MYEKYTWETGEVITAEKLNHLEGGVEDLANSADLQLYLIEDKKLVPVSAEDSTSSGLFAYKKSGFLHFVFGQYTWQEYPQIAISNEMLNAQKDIHLVGDIYGICHFYYRGGSNENHMPSGAVPLVLFLGSQSGAPDGHILWTICPPMSEEYDLSNSVYTVTGEIVLPWN